MSQMSGTPDYLYTIGGDTKAFDKAMKDTEVTANRSLRSVSDAINRQTDGVRKLTGSLRSTLGVFGAVAGIASTVGGMVAVYDKLATAAERVAAANEKSAQATSRSMMAAQAGLRQESPSSGLVGRVTGPLDKRVEELRRELEEMVEKTANAGIGRRFMMGIGEEVRRNLNLIGFDIPDVDSSRMDAIQKDLQDLANMRRLVRKEARDQFEQQSLAESQSVQQSLHVEMLRAQGYNDQAEAMDRSLRVQREITQLEQRQQQLRSDNFHDLAASLDTEIVMRKQIAQATEERLRQERIRTEMIDQQNQRVEADRLAAMLREQALRAEGMDDQADILKIERERLDVLERINAMQSLSSSERQRLVDLAERLAAAQAARIGVDPFASLGSTARGPGFGASVAGNIGGAAAAQVLGGGGNVQQSLDRTRNTTLVSIDRNTGEMVRAVRDAGSRGAVFG